MPFLNYYLPVLSFVIVFFLFYFSCLFPLIFLKLSFVFCFGYSMNFIFYLFYDPYLPLTTFSIFSSNKLKQHFYYISLWEYFAKVYLMWYRGLISSLFIINKYNILSNYWYIIKCFKYKILKYQKSLQNMTNFYPGLLFLSNYEQG